MKENRPAAYRQPYKVAASAAAFLIHTTADTTADTIAHTNGSAQRPAAVSRRPAAAHRCASAERAAKKYYTVRSGDTLGKIARKNGTTVRALCRLNGIKETTTLQIGRRLRVR